MATLTAQRLERLRNRQTLYEVLASDGQTHLLIVYCGRSKTRFFRALAERDSVRGKKLAELAGTEQLKFPEKPDSSLIGTLGKWTIRFSGRTQREAISQGEHRYLEDAVRY